MLDYITDTDFTRLEVIDQEGRVLVKYLKEYERIVLSQQDRGRTLKIFIQNKEET